MLRIWHLVGNTACIFLCAACATLEPQRAIIEPQVATLSAQFAECLNQRSAVTAPEDESWFVVRPGVTPVSVTAPHATEVMSDGKLRYSDAGGTSALAEMLHQCTGAWAIYTTYVAPSDPNYYDDNAFKQSVEQVVTDHNIELVLDIHGSHPFRPYDVDIGTMHGASLLGHQRYQTTLMRALRENGLGNLSSNRFAASEQQTLTKFASGLGAPAIQLEINGGLISPSLCLDEGQASRDYSRLVQALTTYIHSLTCSGRNCRLEKLPDPSEADACQLSPQALVNQQEKCEK